jgi:hypothetical protein
MRSILEASFLTIVCILAAAALATKDQSVYFFADEREVIFEPAAPLPGTLEMFDRIERRTIQFEDGKGEREVCVIILQNRPLERGEGVFLDENGRSKILYDDGMTFLSESDLFWLVDPNTCLLLDPVASQET